MKFSKTFKSFEKRHCMRKHPCLFDYTMRCSDSPYRRKGQGWSVRTGYVPENHKIEVSGSGGLIPYRKNFAILFRKIHDHTDSRFVFKFHIRKSAAGKWVKRCVVLVTKSSLNAFLSPPFCARLAEGGKCLLLEACLPVKLRPNRFRFAGVIPEKVISYTTIMPSVYN